MLSTDKGAKRDTRVTVIIVNWNGKQHLKDCLQALGTQTFDSFDVIVVDNGSSDGSLAMLADEYPDVRVLVNGQNLGFATAINQGVKASASPYLATLNNDVEVAPSWLEALVGAMESSSDVGMCATRMTFRDHPTIVDSAGIGITWGGIAFNRGLGQDVDELDKGADFPISVFGPCAGAALYRRTMLEAIGLFDEDYFAFYEDVDLAWRAQLAGWRCLYVPAAKAVHVHSATASKMPSFKNFLVARNKVWTLIKNFPSPQLFFFGPIILIHDAMAVGYDLLHGNRDSARGRLVALKDIWKVLGKRKAVQRLKTASFREIAAHMLFFEGTKRWLRKERRTKPAELETLYPE